MDCDVREIEGSSCWNLKGLLVGVQAGGWAGLLGHGKTWRPSSRGCLISGYLLPITESLVLLSLSFLWKKGLLSCWPPGLLIWVSIQLWAYPWSSSNLLSCVLGPEKERLILLVTRYGILSQLTISKYHPSPNLRGIGLWGKEILIKGRVSSDQHFAAWGPF